MRRVTERSDGLGATAELAGDNPQALVAFVRRTLQAPPPAPVDFTRAAGDGPARQIAALVIGAVIPVAVNLIGAGAPIVIIAGMPNQDWIIGSDLPNVKDCKDLKGQTVAADGVKEVTSIEGITEYRLDNGVQVLLFPDPSKPTVTVFTA